MSDFICSVVYISEPILLLVGVYWVARAFGWVFSRWARRVLK